jgi:hypothetical protein
MRPRIAIAAVAGLVGLTFLLQGLGYLAGSVMTGDPFWAFVGAVLLAFAVLLAISAFRRGPPR